MKVFRRKLIPHCHRHLCDSLLILLERYYVLSAPTPQLSWTVADGDRGNRLKPNDVLASVNGIDVRFAKIDDVAAMMRTIEVGESVNLVVLRQRAAVVAAYRNPCRLRAARFERQMQGWLLECSIVAAVCLVV